MQALRRVGATALPMSLRTSSTTLSASQTFIAPFSTSIIARSPTPSPSSSASHAAVSNKAASGAGQSIIPLSNIQAQWDAMTEQEQSLVHQQLEALQAKDWRSLSLDEKRAAYYVSFGPHGARVPVTPAGQNNKVALAVLAMLAASTAVWAIARAYSAPPPKTLTKEWEQASTEKAREAKMNPITGISSEGYKGKGFVQSK